MITPEEIVRKATNLYSDAISAWLSGDETYFPRRIPANLRVAKGTSQAELIAAVTRLRVNSKEVTGSGYSVEYELVTKRSHGANQYPKAIRIDSLDDLLKLTGNRTAFKTLSMAVQKLRTRLPALESWLQANWKRLPPIADAIDGLIEVTQYLLDHPQPDCYLRELPLAISTKLIEQNKPLLREWLDLVLPAHSIDHGVTPKHFERRYGFRYPRQHLMIRLLDPSLQAELGLPCPELSLPAEELSRLPVGGVQVIIVENKVNLLTLPARARTIALGGLGNNLAEYERVDWLGESSIFYWGDIDTDGLTILARLRHKFPHLVSFLMDDVTLLSYRSLWTFRACDPQLAIPAELLPHEIEAFRICRDQQTRLEQEHLPQQLVVTQTPFCTKIQSRI